ncbi:contact-dependent growth inhibition system immunity protein [Luteimonas sp. MJ246]|uniref:contact-dependent growth inhibition system immunity protein n=1 Tax=Luteimonas sp. MJ174 TaxID=3129237 RepID=UPI0031BAC761
MSDTPALENFLSAYFHQDWAMEHDTASGVVDAYLGSEADAEIVAVRDDLASLADENLDEPALGARMQSLGCEYDPSREGGSWRAWLASLRDAFSR